MHLNDSKSRAESTTSAFWQQCTGYASLTAVGHQESPHPVCPGIYICAQKANYSTPEVLSAQNVLRTLLHRTAAPPDNYYLRPIVGEALVASQSLLLITDRDLSVLSMITPVTSLSL